MYSYEKYKKYVRNHMKKNPPPKPEDGIGDIYQAFYDSLLIDYTIREILGKRIEMIAF